MNVRHLFLVGPLAALPAFGAHAVPTTLLAFGQIGGDSIIKATNPTATTSDFESLFIAATFATGRSEINQRRRVELSTPNGRVRALREPTQPVTRPIPGIYRGRLRMP